MKYTYGFLAGVVSTMGMVISIDEFGILGIGVGIILAMLFGLGLLITQNRDNKAQEDSDGM